ncbi:hypothetical protein HQ524_03085, partial [Candidatus Uhrbacteria bacterium]|nr:hypothetical protein [Candidatus Uhrbacteria bacterium]
MPEQPQAEKKPERAEDAFSVSVMPKEFRGRDGLMRAYAQDPRIAPPKPQPIAVPKPIVQKEITPAVAANATLQQPLIKPKKTPWVLIGIGGFVVVLLVGLGIVFFVMSPDSEPVAPVATAPTPVAPVPVTPTPVVKSPPVTTTTPTTPST